MLLPFSEGLTRVGKGDLESCLLADAHYSRQSPGANQFMPPGRTIVLRDSQGTVVFGWLWQDKRDDGQRGFNCSIFRNESSRRSSSIILEAEQFALDEWNSGGGAKPDSSPTSIPQRSAPADDVTPTTPQTGLNIAVQCIAHGLQADASAKQVGNH